MATITPSALGAGLSGKAGSVIFARHKGRPYIRPVVSAIDPKTNDQLSLRGTVRKVDAWWQDLPPQFKAQWQSLDTPTGLTPHNLFVRQNVQDLSYPPGTWPVPPATRPVPVARIVPLDSPVKPIDVTASWPATSPPGIKVAWNPGEADPADLVIALAELHATPFDQSAIFAPHTYARTVASGSNWFDQLTPSTSYDLYVIVYHPATARYSIARPMKQTTGAL